MTYLKLLPLPIPRPRAGRVKIQARPSLHRSVRRRNRRHSENLHSPRAFQLLGLVRDREHSVLAREAFGLDPRVRGHGFGVGSGSRADMYGSRCNSAMASSVLWIPTAARVEGVMGGVVRFWWRKYVITAQTRYKHVC